MASRLPLAPLEDEGRLTNARVRDHFLTRLFQTARLRSLPETPGSLVDFHAGSKLLLLAHSEPGLRRLGRLVARVGDGHGVAGSGVAEVWGEYREGFARALAQPPRPGALANALWHAVGHFSKVLMPEEKRVFRVLLEGTLAGRHSLDAPVALIRAWSARHPRPWLAGQSLLEPYPAALRDVADSAGAGGGARVA